MILAYKYSNTNTAMLACNIFASVARVKITINSQAVIKVAPGKAIFLMISSISFGSFFPDNNTVPKSNKARLRKPTGSIMLTSAKPSLKRMINGSTIYRILLASGVIHISFSVSCRPLPKHHIAMHIWV